METRHDSCLMNLLIKLIDDYYYVLVQYSKLYNSFLINIPFYFFFWVAFMDVDVNFSLILWFHGQNLYECFPLRLIINLQSVTHFWGPPVFCILVYKYKKWSDCSVNQIWNALMKIKTLFVICHSVCKS